jgi:hypothetical protein
MIRTLQCTKSNGRATDRGAIIISGYRKTTTTQTSTDHYQFV